MKCLLATLFSVVAFASLHADNPWCVYEGGAGPGKGKHIVLVSGDEEYRSEEALPQLGKILAKRHGFKCTVLFAIDNEGFINPNYTSNIPGLENLASADLLILFTRFRKLPEEQMKHVANYLETGKPIIGMRTATHAFQGVAGTYSKFNNGSKEKGFEGGFGKAVLGEQWVNHHGHHNFESTRGILAKENANHPILRGIKDGDIWGTSDVYTASPPKDSLILVYGQVLTGMKKDDPPVGEQKIKQKLKEGGTKEVVVRKNDPMMPIAWTRLYKTPTGKEARVFTTTLGASQDLEAAGSRRLIVNASYWTLGLESQIPAVSNVDVVGTFTPLPFGNNKFTKGLKPADLQKE